jgi:hypothetical protein
MRRAYAELRRSVSRESSAFAQLVASAKTDGRWTIRAATAWPARKAARINPSIALKTD